MGTPETEEQVSQFEDAGPFRPDTEETKSAGPDRTEELDQGRSSATERAKMIGWQPREDWKGDPGNWVDAETFLEKGEFLLPILKRDREKLFKVVSEQSKKLDEWQKYHREDRERVAKREYERGLKELRARQKAAVEIADSDAFEAIEREREELDKSYREEVDNGSKSAASSTGGAVPAGTGTVTEQDATTFIEWARENPWYEKDGELTTFAKSVAPFVQAQGGWKTKREYLDKVTEEVKLRYPRKFENPRRSESTGVEGSEFLGPTPPRTRKTYADLPAEAKAQCSRMKEAGMKVEEFVNEYFGQEVAYFKD